MVQGLQKITLQAHIEQDLYFTGCLVFGLLYDQVIEKIKTGYLNQTAEPGESVRVQLLNSSPFNRRLQCGVYTVALWGVLRAAPCDKLTITVNHGSPSTGTQVNRLPLF